MWHIAWDGTKWSGWENLFRALLRPPDCGSWRTNPIHCFVRGPDQRIGHTAGDGPQWGGGGLGGHPPAGPGCVSGGPNRLDCFILGTDGTMSHKSRCAPTCDGVLAVSTYHYDTLRTGWNSHERVLTAQNVASSQFGLLQVVPPDDQVDAQPLFVANQDVSHHGFKQDVTCVVTEDTTPYAT